ncbi:MAG: hypothetical protein Ct9H300mP28_16090 [Pseudomonadota bacterium]|nr:MAG: hypothetical protein Ct9H300mP28_16090 [Pseudomonadota bacterium]
MNFLTLSGSTESHVSPYVLDVNQSRSRLNRKYLVYLSMVTPVFASRGVSGIDSRTFLNSARSTLIPVIIPETQITSALEEKNSTFCLDI